MILDIWEEVLMEKKDHGVLGYQNCRFLSGLRTWKYCPQSQYHKKHPAHFCLSSKCCGRVDWEEHNKDFLYW